MPGTPEQREPGARYEERREADRPGQTRPVGEPPTRRTRLAQAGVALLFFVNGTTVGSWVPHIPDRAQALGLDSAELGATLLAGGIGCVAAMPISGWLIGRWGTSQVSTFAGVAFPALLALAVVAPTRNLLALALVLVGMAGASMDVGMNAHGVLVERYLGRHTISLFHGLFSVGCVAGSLITGAALARHVAARIIAFSLALALGCMVLAARRVLLADQTRTAGRQPAAAPNHAEGGASAAALPGTGPKATRPATWLTGLRHRLPYQLPHGRLLLLGVLTFSAMVSEGAVADWSALLLRVTRGLGDGVVGYGFTCFSSAMVLGRFTGDRVVARTGEAGALRLGGALGMLGFGLMLASTRLPWMLVGFAVAGLGLSNASPILYRAAGKLPGYRPGAAIAVAVGVGYVGLLAGPPLLGFLAHAAGLRSIFYVLLGLCMVLGLAATLVNAAARPGRSQSG